MTSNDLPRGYHKYIAAIDLETTGVFFSNKQESPVVHEKTGEYYQIVSAGIVIVESDSFEPVEKRYYEVKWNGESLWAAEAESVHGLTKTHLEQHGISEEDFLCEFAELIIKYFGTGTICTLGHNSTKFDLVFLQHLADRYGMYFNFGNRHIDTYALASVCWDVFNSDDLFWKAGLPERSAHNALEDIEFTLDVVRRTRMFFKHGLNDMLNN